MSTESYFDVLLSKLSAPEDPEYSETTSLNIDNEPPKCPEEPLAPTVPRKFLNDWDDFQATLDRIQNDIQKEIHRAELKFNELKKSVQNMETEFIETSKAKLDEIIPTIPDMKFSFP